MVYVLFVGPCPLNRLERLWNVVVQLTEDRRGQVRKKDIFRTIAVWE